MVYPCITSKEDRFCEKDPAHEPSDSEMKNEIFNFTCYISYEKVNFVTGGGLCVWFARTYLEIFRREVRPFQRFPQFFVHLVVIFRIGLKASYKKWLKLISRRRVRTTLDPSLTKLLVGFIQNVIFDF